MDNNQPQVLDPNTDKSAQPELTITDLQNLRTIVDMAVRRGAFPATEMSAVGSVFDKLNAFLIAALPPEPQQK